MAVSSVSLPDFPPFDVHIDGNIGPRWKKYLARFEQLLIATNITEAKQQHALLLHYAGPAVDEIFDTLPDTGEDKDCKKAIDALNTYFIPQANTAFEEYNFRQAKQQQGEIIDAYHTRLRRLAQTCDFTNVDKEVKTQIIIGCLSHKLRRQALRDNPTLANLLAAGRAHERSEEQAAVVEKGTSEVNALKYKTKPNNQLPKSTYHQKISKPLIPPDNNRNPPAPPTPRQQCRNCGGIFPHTGDCPAKGKECRSCGKSGHFAKVCRSKPKHRAVRQIDDSPMDDPDYIFTVKHNQQPSPSPLCEVYIAKEPVKTIIDSGASVNIIDELTYDKIRNQDQSISTVIQATFYVTQGGNGNLLSNNTAESLGILKITVNTALNTPTTSPEDQFQHLFDGIGKIKDKVIKLHIDSDVQPKQQPHRRIPFHIRKDVEAELQRLEELDIIEKVDEPTPWVSPVVVVPKKTGAIRLCVDMREANKAVRREKHLMPTLDELITDLNGATVFSTLDLTSGYHQLELDPASRHITTFSTHIGLRRYKRLMFGINAASEIF
ncbi:uncharacterized protein LOC114529243 [Dendronephthya gigantea]|uniref:uncharacterized protein LOC114529243 n=1 Tax=Dendronephthya gigantea TaxID=151771 RepID=UPI00106BCAD3|nr:uncharacterized protein LOC114529243 [Dendronephthya gigantea]